MFSYSLRSVLFFGAAALAAYGQVKAPMLDTAAKAGDTRIHGMAATPLANQAGELRVYRKDKAELPSLVLMEAGGLKFEIELSKPLAAGDTLHVTQVVNGAESAASNDIKLPEEKKPDPIKLVIRSVDAVIGSTAVVVFFEPVELDSAEVAVDSGQQSLVRAVTAAELKAGKLQVDLVKPVLPADPRNATLAGTVDGKQTEAKILTLEERPASKDVVVVFNPVPTMTAAKIKVEAAGQPISRDVTPAELTAGILTVSGVAPLVPRLAATLRGKKKGVEVVEASKNGAVVPASLQVYSPLREGEREIKGYGGTTIKRVYAFVLGGAYSASQVCDGGSGVAGEPGVSASPLTPPSPAAVALAPAYRAYAKQKKLEQEVAKTPSKQGKQTAPANPPVDWAARDRAADCLRESEEEVNKEVRGGEFIINLQRPLMAGQRVVVCEVYPDAGGDRVSGTNCDRRIVQPVALDWGRMKGIFALGGVVTKRDSFSQISPYISGYFDLNVWNCLLDSCLTHKPTNSSDPDSLFGHAKLGFSLHTFADVRLTQAAGAQPEGAALSASTAAYLAAGVYAPFRFGGMDWVHKGTQYSAFVAPLFKAGVTRLKDGVLLQSTPGETGKPAIEKRDDGAVPFYGYGTRFGLMRYDVLGPNLRNRQVSPDPQAYLDLTWGKDGVYRKGRESGPTTIFDKGRVMTVEGRVKIPCLPAQIGADVVIFNSQPQRAASDFRFHFSTRIDAAKLFGKFMNN